MKPTGFNSWAPPDLAWMLRIIIAISPETEKQIVNYRSVKVNFQEQMLKDEKIVID